VQTTELPHLGRSSCLKHVCAAGSLAVVSAASYSLSTATMWKAGSNAPKPSAGIPAWHTKHSIQQGSTTKDDVAWLISNDGCPISFSRC
jgi:hypothetical protein